MDLDTAGAALDAAGVAMAGGRLHEAGEQVRVVLENDPDHSRALGMLGQLAMLLGRHVEAVTPLRRARDAPPPGHAGAAFRCEFGLWLCLCLHHLGRRVEALGVLGEIIDTLPPAAGAHFAVALVLERFGCLDHAARLYERCVALDPHRADAHHRHARLLHATGRQDAAIESYAAAIRVCTAQAGYFVDLSAALSDLGRFEEACAAARIAADRDPGCVEACTNLGHALLNLNRSAEAVGWYEKAVALRAGDATAQFGYAVALLKAGDFARGWAAYEWRWRDCQRPRDDLAMPAWQGEPLAGRTLLLHAEQGFGDTLQFVRFAPLLAAKGARVLLEVPPPLVRLLARVEGVAGVVACGDPLPDADLHCPIASLPWRVGLRLETIPALPYLRSAATGTAWIPRPAAGRGIGREAGREAGLVVGLVWAGDPRPGHLKSNLIDRRRSASLALLAPLFEIAGIEFVSFQLGEARGQIAVWEGRIADAMEGVRDFADTAARLSTVDLLISVDTAMAHLAGGLGMPVWMLSRFDACWRWLEKRDDTPWYPSMRIFRQASPGDWAGLVSELGAALRDRLARGAAGRSASLYGEATVSGAQ